MAQDVKHLFVYGTLMSGQPNHRCYCADAVTVEPAVTTGRLYHLPMGFPAMIEADDRQVFGEAMTFPDLPAKLAVLDHLEGYRPDQPEHSLYVRRVRPITLLRSHHTVRAHCYIWARPLSADAAAVEAGSWQNRRTSPGPA